MTEPYPWYELVQGSDLAQGDVLRACPIFHPLENNEYDEIMSDVVVLSQTCDLVNDKLTLVLVCPVFPLSLMMQSAEFLKSKRVREALRRGNFPGFHLLNRCEFPGFESDYLVCDFRSIYSIHLSVAKSQLVQTKERLRLRSPYREHLAQALARFLMRVGLPVDIPPFS